ncbi:MAG: sigma-70 family RNA polymerase sigma factor [Methyloglobulus sp.]|nr:sigma-70 family RNA polymerase sigma factor [Methyloglobulus sp.]
MYNLTADALTDLMQAYERDLLRFLSQRVRCDEDAQDIVQETFIRYAQYSKTNRVENARAFIYRVAANLATDYYRNHARRAYADITPEVMAETIIDPAPLPDQCAMSEQQVEMLIQALAELPPKCRDVFIMLRLKNQTYAEVEQALGISQTMILKYLTRTLSHCRQKLEES